MSRVAAGLLACTLGLSACGSPAPGRTLVASPSAPTTVPATAGTTAAQNESGVPGDAPAPVDSPPASPASPASSSSPLEHLSGKEVARLAAAALRRAGSFTYTATYGGSAWISRRDLQIEGDAASGTYVDQGIEMRIIGAGSTSYELAPVDYWTAQQVPEAKAKQLAMTWVRQTTAPGLRDFPTADSIGKSLVAPDFARLAKKVGPATFEGRPVVTLSYDDGSLVYVAATGEPLPIYLKMVHGGGSTVTLTNFGRAHAESPPATYLKASALYAILG